MQSGVVEFLVIMFELEFPDQPREVIQRVLRHLDGLEGWFSFETILEDCVRQILTTLQEERPNAKLDDVLEQMLAAAPEGAAQHIDLLILSEWGRLGGWIEEHGVDRFDCLAYVKGVLQGSRPESLRQEGRSLRWVIRSWIHYFVGRYGRRPGDEPT
jgi:hypothetical protein